MIAARDVSGDGALASRRIVVWAGTRPRLFRHSKNFTTEDTEDHGGPRRLLARPRMMPNVIGTMPAPRLMNYKPIDRSGCQTIARTADGPVSPWPSVVLSVLRGKALRSRSRTRAYARGTVLTPRAHRHGDAVPSPRPRLAIPTPRWTALLLALPLLIPVSSRAALLSAPDLLTACSGDAVAKATCDGYIGGIADLVLQREGRGHTGGKLCLPDSVTHDQLRDAVLSVAHRPRAAHAPSGAMLVMLAMRATWPCNEAPKAQ